VETEDQWMPGGQRVYKRPRIVAVLRSGMVHCTCCMDRYMGIPCRHFFMVMRSTEHQDIGFGLTQIHSHWIDPQHRLSSSVTKDWVYLYDVHATSDSSLRDLPSATSVSPTPSVPPTPSFPPSNSVPPTPNFPPSNSVPPTPGGSANKYPSETANGGGKRENDPGQQTLAKRSRFYYGELQAKIQRMTDLNLSPKTFAAVNKTLEDQIAALEGKCFTANKSNKEIGAELGSFLEEKDASQGSPRDPPIYRGPGRKRLSRIKSSVETRCGKARGTKRRGFYSPG